MEKLESYLTESYIKETKLKKSVSELIEKVIPVYENFNNQKGWGYELLENPSDVSTSANSGVSTSTTSMVAFSMSVLMSGNPDLVIKEINNDLHKYFENINEELRDKLKDISKKSLKLLFKTYKEETDEKEEYTFFSNTYGKNDPFTLVWTKYLIDNNNDIIAELQEEMDEFDNILKEFKNECETKVNYIVETFYTNKSEVKFTEKINNFHVFPLLKIIQLYKSINLEIKDSKFITEVRNFLKSRLHNHLSLAPIDNSNFDTAELVFSLEGLLLLDPNKDNFDINLIERVFSVIKERQKISLYWRPLKPFVLNKQGLALLPLSVEIAMSLIRICRLLGKKGEILFSENYITFEKYTEWIKTRVSVVSLNNKKYCGWCSEHIYQPDVIHPWETSQVLVYLANFNDMLQKHIAYQSLKYTNLSLNNLEEDKEAWEKWKKKEPVNIEDLKIYEDIGHFYVFDEDERYYSMLLYGPPGTGKTSLAKNIAKTKGWPILTITPSDFIANGADQVETKAKNIFKVLGEQSNMVVFFDEIDRLILDRDSKLYSEQSDIFQFMTPSMLVKINDLREKEKLIFIIATNYEERIDKAIKRKGRIDKKYLVLPPDKMRREEHFKNLWSEEESKNIDKEYEETYEKCNEVYEKCKETIVNNTVLFVWGELNQLKADIRKLINDNLKSNKEIKRENILKLIGRPSISLKSYTRKFSKESDKENSQSPIKEFLSLSFLMSEIVKDNKDNESYKDNEAFFKRNESEFKTIGDVFNIILGQGYKKDDFHNKFKDELRDKSIRNTIFDALNEYKKYKKHKEGNSID